MSDIISLRQMQIGQSGRIATVEALGETGRRIRDMGLIPGTRVTLRKVAPMGDPIQLQVRGYELTIRREDAAKITLKEEQL